LTYSQLIEVPAHAERHVNVVGRDAALSTWRDLLPDAGVRLVTQYYQPGAWPPPESRQKALL